MENELDKNPAIIFPEIIGITIIALYTPFYLYKLFQIGHYLISGLGFLMWGIGVYFTIYSLKEKNYFLAIFPMLVILGVGYLINIYTGVI